jgi:hypothetical protein
MGKSLDPSLTSPHQIPRGSCGMLNGKYTLEAMEKMLQHQGTDHHNPKKAASRDQLRASTTEAMANIVLQVTSHKSYFEFLQNLHDGD